MNPMKIQVCNFETAFYININSNTYIITHNKNYYKITNSSIITLLHYHTNYYQNKHIFLQTQNKLILLLYIHKNQNFNQNFFC